MCIVTIQKTWIFRMTFWIGILSPFVMVELQLRALWHWVVASHIELNSLNGIYRSHNPKLIYRAMLHDYKMVYSADWVQTGKCTNLLQGMCLEQQGCIFIICCHLVSLIFVFSLWVCLFYYRDQYLLPNLAGQESDSCICGIQQFGIKLWVIQVPRCKFKYRKILRTEPVLF